MNIITTLKKIGVKKMLLTITAVLGALAASWYALFGLKPYTVTMADVTQRYAYVQPPAIDFELKADNNNGYHFTYRSFDGSLVNGYLRMPYEISNEPVPVIIGAHAMGRNHLRWWQDSYNDRPTRENTDKITQLALEQGYAVITIDARHHGERKDPDLSIADIIHDLHWWGKRAPYEQMLIDTVRDHRVLLDWVVTQPQFDPTRIDVAGYSMGAQVSLLLGAVDDRVQRIAAVVPPHVNERTAMVAPLHMLPGLADNPVLLLTANDDEYATKRENQQLYQALPNADKQHHAFDGGHLLPADYVQQFERWLQ